MKALPLSEVPFEEILFHGYAALAMVGLVANCSVPETGDVSSDTVLVNSPDPGTLASMSFTIARAMILEGKIRTI